MLNKIVVALIVLTAVTCIVIGIAGLVATQIHHDPAWKSDDIIAGVNIVGGLIIIGISAMFYRESRNN